MNTTPTSPKFRSPIKLVLFLLHSFQHLYWRMHQRDLLVKMSKKFQANMSNYSLNKITLPESTDYSVLFYIMAGFKITAAVLIFWLKVKVERSPQSTKESMKKIWNKSALILFAILFILGVVAGVKETYAIPYLTDDLGASSQLISVLDLI